MKNSSPSLKRLSVIMAALGLVALIAGLVSAGQANLKEVASLLQVAGAIILGIGAVGLIIDARQQIMGFSRTRQARYGANAIILTLSFVGVVVLLNYVVYRHPLRADLTANKSFSISDQTRKIISGLKDDIQVTAFYSATNPMRQEASDLLETYKVEGKGRLKVEIVDPIREPARAQQMQITSDGTTIFALGDRKKTVSNSQEQDFTNALLSLTQASQPKVYFLQGHGELDPDSFDQRLGLSNLKQMMTQENYQVAKLQLLESKQVPADARAVVIAGPEKPLLVEERTALQDYLDKRQGRVLVMLRAQTQTGLESLLSGYGLTVGNDLVVDPTRHFWNDVAAPAVTEYRFHPITEKMKSATFFPAVRSVRFTQSPPAGVSGVELALSSPQSWAETNLKDLTQVRQDAQDSPGPVSLAVAVTITPKDAEKDKAAEGADKKAPESRLVVVGNHLFASNAFIKLGNGDFFLNSLAWLAEEENLISIRAKTPEQNQIELTNQQTSLIYNLTVYLVPLLMLLLGAFVWWKRR